MIRALSRASSALACSAFLALSASAQATLGYASGVLGDTLHANVSGPPLLAFGVAPSLGVGPTPLALFDPADPRSLDVGLDLWGLWTVDLLDAAGDGRIDYPLPADPGLAGIVLHVQAVTSPGATTLVDEITNAVQVELALPGSSIATLGSPHVARRMHGGTGLGDGRMLLSGGVEPATLGGGAPKFLPGAEVFDPQTGSFGTPFSIGAPRAMHTATRLDDGRVLLLGGVTTGGSVLAGGVVVDPQARSFIAVPSMTGARVLHTATPLANGKVLVVGGSGAYDVEHPIGHAPVGSLTKAGPLRTQLYDPATNTWSNGPLLPAALAAHRAVRLDDGRVLILGGWRFPAGGTPAATALAWLYNPALNTLSPASPLSKPVAFHLATKTRKGDVIVVGGGAPDVVAGAFHPLDRSFLYDATAGAFFDRAAPPGITGGIVTPSGETICICTRPSIPLEGFGTLGGCNPTAPTTYAVSVSSTLTNLGTGAIASSGTILTTDNTISSWSSSGTYTTNRTHAAIVPQGDGARVLISGGEPGAASPSAELWIVEY